MGGIFHGRQPRAGKAMRQERLIDDTDRLIRLDPNGGCGLAVDFHCEFLIHPVIPQR
jgi:hypothetical protein